MVRSLGLIAVIVAVSLIFVPGLLHPSKSQRFPAADVSDYLTGFRQISGRAALAPRPVPKGWYANGGALNGTKASAHLHIGWVAPGAKYAGLEESVQRPAVFVPAVLGRRGATVTGSEAINGTSWQTSTSSRGEHSLTATISGLTVVITGNATDAQLQQLAGSLR
jgi:hypothetical protein